MPTKVPPNTESSINYCAALKRNADFLLPGHLEETGDGRTMGSRSNPPTEYAKLTRSSLAKCCLGLLLVSLFSLQAFAETLRVTTWNMQETTGGDAERAVQETASAILKADPDVILLQHVRDWKMCLQLADALRPSMYNVLVCSAFREARGGSNQQAAILSKWKAQPSPRQ